MFATGFDAVTGNYVKIDIRGRDGEQLREKWADGPRGHLGLVTAGFPNLFMIFGPMGPFTNQPPAHEFQVDWVADAIEYVRDHGLGTIEADHASRRTRGWTSATRSPTGRCSRRSTRGSTAPTSRARPVSVNFYMGGMGAYVERMREHRAPTTTRGSPSAQRRGDPVATARLSPRRLVQSRFAAIWVALAVLIVITLLIGPSTLSEQSLSTVTPLASVLAIAAFGQTLVIMTGGIDLSIPAGHDDGGDRRCSRSRAAPTTTSSRRSRSCSCSPR